MPNPLGQRERERQILGSNAGWVGSDPVLVLNSAGEQRDLLRTTEPGALTLVSKQRKVSGKRGTGCTRQEAQETLWPLKQGLISGSSQNSHALSPFKKPPRGLAKWHVG